MIRVLLFILLAVILGGWRTGLTCQANGLVGYGDSITVGDLANNQSYFYYTQSPPAYKYNGAVSGSTVTGTGDDPGWAHLNAFVASLVASRCQSAIVVVSELFGFNDYSSNRLDFSRFSDWADARRTAGAKVICSTLLPSTDASVSPGYNTWRNSLNTEMRTWAPGGGGTRHCDGLSDFAADATMGPDTAPNNAALYVDKIHPTTVGQQTLWPIYQSALRLLIP